MSTLKIDISDMEQHQSAVKKLIDFAGKEHVFLFEAPMGAGKTTFIKSICAYLNVSSTMSSPTYSVVNEYDIKTGGKIFHFDLYRLKSGEELFELGFEDYVDSGNYIFIEWPELALLFLNSYLRIIINIENNNRYLCAEIIRPS